MDQRKKKIYTIMLVASGVVLLVNYVLFPAEDAPRLAPVGAKTVSLHTAKSAETVAEVDAIPELVFPRGLPNWPLKGQNRDIFEAPYDSADGASSSVAVNAGSATTAGSDRTGQAAFANHHRLQMVLDDKLRPIAVVDNQWLNLGDNFDQCKLLSVKGTTALFGCYDGEVLLELQTTSAN